MRRSEHIYQRPRPRRRATAHRISHNLESNAGTVATRPSRPRRRLHQFCSLRNIIEMRGRGQLLPRQLSLWTAADWASLRDPKPVAGRFGAGQNVCITNPGIGPRLELWLAVRVIRPDDTHAARDIRGYPNRRVQSRFSRRSVGFQSDSALRPSSRTFSTSASAATNVYGPASSGRVRNASTCASRSGHLADLRLRQGRDARRRKPQTTLAPFDPLRLLAVPTLK